MNSFNCKYCDREIAWEELRKEWISGGMVFWAREIERVPENWNPTKQLSNLINKI